MSNKQFSIDAKQIQIISCAAARHATQCRGCGKTVDLVTFPAASEIVGVTIDEIINRAAAGTIHLVVRPEALLICLNSLLAIDFRAPKKRFVYRAAPQRAFPV